jgi:hypothetical protein
MIINIEDYKNDKDILIKINNLYINIWHSYIINYNIHISYSNL